MEILVIDNSFSYAFGPLVALCGIVILVVILRWAFSGKRISLVATSGKPGLPQEYGTLVSIASPPNHIEGEMMRRYLQQAGVKANLTHTLEGPQLFVFPKDKNQALKILEKYKPH